MKCESCGRTPATHWVDFGDAGPVFACCTNCAEVAPGYRVTVTPLTDEVQA